MQDRRTWAEIEEWVGAARGAHSMRTARMGILGNYYSGMLDLYTDVTLQSVVFGTRAEFIEMCELSALREGVPEDEVDAKIAEFNEKFEVSPECSDQELRRAAKTSAALDKLVGSHGLDSLAY